MITLNIVTSKAIGALSRIRNNPFISCLLIVTLLCSQALPRAISRKENRIQVAFIGIQFDKVPPDVQRGVLARLNDMLARNKDLEVLSAKGLEQRMDGEALAAALESPGKEALRIVSEALQVDYVYSGHLSNQSPDPDRTLLVGDFMRYDRQTQALYRYEIAKYYEGFGVEVVRIGKQLVDTIVPPREGRELKSVIWVFAGIGLLALIAFSLVSIDAGAKGDEDGTNGPDTP